MPLPTERRSTRQSGAASFTNAPDITPNTGVTFATQAAKMVKHIQLTLTGFVVNIAAADDYGGTKLLDFPDTNIMLMAVEADMSLVKGEAVGGLVGTTDITVAIGTAVASASTLATTMEDVQDAIAYTPTLTTVPHQIHSSADATLAYPILLGDSATLALYFNLAAAITTDDVLTCSGTIDLYYVDLGNVTS